MEKLARWYDRQPMGHALTIRLPEAVYQAAKKMADRRGISMNRLVQEALTEKADDKAEKPDPLGLAEAYDLLAEDAAECDAEGFFALQAEAILDA